MEETPPVNTQQKSSQLSDLDTEITDQLVAASQNLGLNCIKRHIFICADATKPKCIDRESSLESWEYLKKRLKELKIDRPTNERSDVFFRTKANCLRICQYGPIAVVYPDGVWYHSVTPTVVEEIIQRHLLRNEIVSEYAFCQHSLVPKNSV
jgi:(2Fe-2S) ferredoxin